MQNRLNRRKSRAIAMELLYSGTVNARSGEITEEFLDDFISMSETTENLDRTYIRTILNIVEGKEGYLKGVISPFLKDWDINRLSRVNLSILKIAAGELLFMDDIPDRVSLNEAIELSKVYSDEESTSFINGVLDKILKAKAQGKIESEIIVTEAEIAPDTSVLGQDTESSEEIKEVDSQEPAEVKAEATAEAILEVEAEDTIEVVTEGEELPEGEELTEVLTDIVVEEPEDVLAEVVVEEPADVIAEVIAEAPAPTDLDN